MSQEKKKPSIKDKTKREVIIKNIEFRNNNGPITIEVQCLACGATCSHTISHAVTKDEGTSKIDFSQLGNRCCENMECNARYNLYH